MSRTIVSRQESPFEAALRVFGAAGLALGLMLAAAGVEAREPPVCADRDALAERLAARFAERPVAGGLDAAGRLVEVFARADGTSWTMLATRPDGGSCVVATGRFWQARTPPGKEAGA